MSSVLSGVPRTRDVLGTPFLKGECLMKQNRLKVTTIKIVILLIMLGLGVPVNASAPDFTVQAILPESQVNDDVSYFDLNLEPNQKETLELEVKNNSDQPVELELSANSAVTNINGVIDYSKSSKNTDDSMKVPFSTIATLDTTEVSLESNESKIISLIVEMPSDSIKGIILGGITVSEKEKNEENSSQVTNLFSYSIAVMISQESAELDSVIKLKGVSVEQRNKRNVIVASLQNPVAKIMNDVKVEAKIFKGTQNDPLYYTMRSDMRMAPNSTLDFGVTTNDKKLKAGVYRLEGVVTSGEESWSFEESFEITKEKANNLNETAVNLATDNTLIYVWAAFGIVVLIVVVMGMLAMKRLKKREEERK